ncbi:hypothetical protein COW36_06170 [bacterium (Candidatus Blackallbacteria) CG17_big_fil_post_rev_8_21_14_2_50_48_46]|uniref:Uncharacterized protein n=1 Tax=bacterium (Candidatus Blackallbacteria) CG17_big_fil_post_rev_8_21_14_2_50_48_46 TaxID=2014261 RepID=A0A2M7G7Q4_9BACT|nr:MAG: hypothetical protein COW64_17000 [bacterium (Candidatus Blackallbacteria) CG18_big_fil_WC_8_21_14_2_50_49_26]PIW18112.1 MAG: hypothetical protein COW36_06170 [bacterium (Candidatus Blackallbacteria) CG17_big_fil_post_rev_8_21_14_2_50_48_46]PIW51121.1 MAG: hypothetical protein COW20_00320 [bacterium (Candidatus Blackallbacteria) CG13_big_fil_rev_8_21_14_2_50_49_14]
MQISNDLIILGETPASSLLALLVARSGQKVTVAGPTVPVSLWALAESPYDWFGETPAAWPESWLQEKCTGLVSYLESGETLLTAWPTHILDFTKVQRQMRADAQGWGVNFSKDQEFISEAQPSTLILDLRPTDKIEAGYWFWQTEAALIAPGMLEFFQGNRLLVWTQSLGPSTLALAGTAQAPPDLHNLLPDLALEGIPPQFQAFCLPNAQAQLHENTLTLPSPQGDISPLGAVHQTLLLLWARYAGLQLAQYGCQDKNARGRLCDYWSKLITGTQHRYEKYYFLR